MPAKTILQLRPVARVEERLLTWVAAVVWSYSVLVIFLCWCLVCGLDNWLDSCHGIIGLHRVLVRPVYVRDEVVAERFDLFAVVNKVSQPSQHVRTLSLQSRKHLTPSYLPAKVPLKLALLILVMTIHFPPVSLPDPSSVIFAPQSDAAQTALSPLQLLELNVSTGFSSRNNSGDARFGLWSRIDFAYRGRIAETNTVETY